MVITTLSTMIVLMMLMTMVMMAMRCTIIIVINSISVGNIRAVIIIRHTTVVMPTHQHPENVVPPKWLRLNTWLMLVRNGSDCPGELRESQCPWALMHVHDRPEDVTGTSPCRPEQSSGQQGVWSATSPGQSRTCTTAQGICGSCKSPGAVCDMPDQQEPV